MKKNKENVTGQKKQEEEEWSKKIPNSQSGRNQINNL